MIKKHPRLVTLVGIVAMLSAFIVPAALAAPGPGPDSPACQPGRNPHCQATTTTRTTTRTTTSTGTGTVPPTGTETITDTVTDTTGAFIPPGCANKGLTEPPCGGNSGTQTSASSGIPIGVVFLVLGLAVMSYLWIHRRRTLKLDA